MEATDIGASQFLDPSSTQVPKSLDIVFPKMLPVMDPFVS